MTNRRTSWTAAPTIPVRFVQEMFSQSKLTKQERDSLLRRVGLAPEMLRRPRHRVSAQRFYEVHRQVVRRLDDECYGYLRRAIPVGTYMTLVRTWTRMPNLAACLNSSIDFYRLFDGHPVWGLAVDGDRATLSLRFRTEAQSRSILYTSQMLIASWRTMAWLSGEPWPLLKLGADPRFRTLSGQMRFLFGREPEWRAGRAEIVFPARVLALPVVRTVEQANRYGAESLFELIAAAPSTTLEGQIRTLLAASKPFASASAPEVAEQLGMSTATLHRRLKQLRLTFQSLKDDLRRDRAIALLTEGGHRLSAIAEEVGYSEPSAFQRAFKTWTGVAPGRFRA